MIAVGGVLLFVQTTAFDITLPVFNEYACEKLGYVLLNIVNGPNCPLS